MFYEGMEKRLVITVNTLNLLDLPDKFWSEMVSKAGAFIISKISNNKVTAYLLSESSLFVWNNKIVLITCGNTQLIKAALFFQEYFKGNEISSVLFQRHKAIKPELQSTDFSCDRNALVQNLSEKLIPQTVNYKEGYKGEMVYFNSTNLSLMGMTKILMLQDLNGVFADELNLGVLNSQQIQNKLIPKEFFSDLIIDEYTFTPKGYSLNAIMDHCYLTIHITPEKDSSYLSLETNIESVFLAEFVKHLISICLPNKKVFFEFDNINKMKILEL